MAEELTRVDRIKSHYRLLRIELKLAALAQAASVDFIEMDQDLDQELNEKLAEIN